MQVILDTKEIASVGIHNVEREDFTRIMKSTGEKLVSIDGYWLLNSDIGKVTLTFFSQKEKCVCCKKADVDDPRVDYCGDCFEEIEEQEARERTRQRREDAYDASRGH